MASGNSSSTLLRLLVIFLGLSQLIPSLNAIPITRIEKLMRGPQVLEVSDTTHMFAEEKSLKERVTSLEGRMEVELHDYPGSGANHRHTPWPPQLRCADC